MPVDGVGSGNAAANGAANGAANSQGNAYGLYKSNGGGTGEGGSTGGDSGVIDSTGGSSGSYGYSSIYNSYGSYNGYWSDFNGSAEAVGSTGYFAEMVGGGSFGGYDYMGALDSFMNSGSSLDLPAVDDILQLMEDFKAEENQEAKQYQETYKTIEILPAKTSEALGNLGEALDSAASASEETSTFTYSGVTTKEVVSNPAQAIDVFV